MVVTARRGARRSRSRCRSSREIERTLPSLCRRASCRRAACVRSCSSPARRPATCTRPGVARALQRGAPDLALDGRRRRRGCASAGVELLEHAERLAVMGFVEVLEHVPRHYRAAAVARAAPALAAASRSLVLIDYPGFNMKLAAAARGGGRAGAVLHHAAGVGVGRGPAARAGADRHEGGGDPAVRGGAAARRTASTRRSSAIRCSIAPATCPTRARRARALGLARATTGARAVSRGAARRRSIATSTTSSRPRASSQRARSRAAAWS